MSSWSSSRLGLGRTRSRRTRTIRWRHSTPPRSRHHPPADPLGRNRDRLLSRRYRLRRVLIASRARARRSLAPSLPTPAGAHGEGPRSRRVAPTVRQPRTARRWCRRATRRVQRFRTSVVPHRDGALVSRWRPTPDRPSRHIRRTSASASHEGPEPAVVSPDPTRSGGATHGHPYA
jgi:hypothetical protein